MYRIDFLPVEALFKVEMNFSKDINKFFGGIKLLDRKKAAEYIPFADLPLPGKVIIPLVQHIGEPALPIVKKGDYVKIGQLIAMANGFISSNIHSSISGTVKEVEKFPHPKTGAATAVLIESDNTDSMFEQSKPLSSSEIEKLSIEEILQIIENAGIVGLGGAAFPTHAKLKIARDKKVHTYIVNAVECEPFITCDYRLMLERTREIIAGLKLAVKVTNAKKVFIGIKKTKRQIIKIFNEVLQGEKNMKIFEVDIKYPQGAEKQLIKTILNREVPSGKLPLDIGVAVNNVATLYAVCEAVYKGKALYEQFVTVSGNGVVNPANLKVRIGTPVKNIVEFCGMKPAEKTKIIVGGPMMGCAQNNLDAPIIKGSSCVLVFIDKEVKVFQDDPCIKCGRCVGVCPAKILPAKIAQLVKRDKIDELDKFNINDCIECGLCAYVCPASIPIVEYIKLGKVKKRRK